MSSALKDLVASAMCTGAMFLMEAARDGKINRSAPLIESLGDEPAEFLRIRQDLTRAVNAEYSAASIDVAHIVRQRQFSERAFGPGTRTAGVLDHLAKELDEIRAAPDDLSEWADLIILAIDGAWRSGGSPAEIIGAVKAKQAVNEARRWPDWRTADPEKAIEHIRGGAE